MTTTGSPVRPASWKWTVCGLLLLATMLNYMNRLTLNLTAVRIKDYFTLDNSGYGGLESAFGIAFALGAICGGLMVDRWNVRWVYPAAVLAWSAAGAVTGLVEEYHHLLLCRIWLGFAEAIHWPCALRTTQRILSADQRTLGNSILQSGAALGAVITPIIVLVLVDLTDTWRYPFVTIGGLGIFWVVLWLMIVRNDDLALPQASGKTAGPSGSAESLWGVFMQRRFAVLVIIVICVNVTWHFFRVWLLLFLQVEHGYTERTTQLFLSGYYLSTYVGSLSAGFTTLWLVRVGWSVHRSRLGVFTFCSFLTALSLLASQLPAGPMLLLVLLVIGFAALGLFPCYYSFTQELTVKHQGKLTGTLGFINWMAMALLHWGVGKLLDQTKDYTTAVAVVGLAPLLAVVALVLLWGKGEKAAGIVKVVL